MITKSLYTSTNSWFFQVECLLVINEVLGHCHFHWTCSMVQWFVLPSVLLSHHDVTSITMLQTKSLLYYTLMYKSNHKAKSSEPPENALLNHFVNGTFLFSEQIMLIFLQNFGHNNVQSLYLFSGRQNVTISYATQHILTVSSRKLISNS